LYTKNESETMQKNKSKFQTKNLANKEADWLQEKIRR